MKYKTGQGVEILDGIYKGQVGVIDFIGEIDGYRPYRIKLNIGGYEWLEEEDLKPLPKTWETLAVGDIVVCQEGDKAKVLARDGDVYLRSYLNAHNVTGVWCTLSVAQDNGWTIEGAEDDDVDITVEGETKRISRKSAKALGLIK